MLTVEYVTPDGLIQESFEMADGMTLNQAACTICPDTGCKFPVPTIAIVGSRPALKSKGDWDFKLSDAKIQFRQLAMGGGGGGSNPLQMVLQIAFIALAAVTTWWMGGWGVFAVGGALEGMGSLFGGLAGAGIMMLGTLLTGVLFPNKMPQGQLGANQAEQASPTYSINASGNQARLYQAEPEGFGRMKITPDFVANTWTQYIGNDQIGYFVYAIGRGEYDVESLQFGETVFWRNGAIVEESGYDIQAIEFVKPGNPVTIFPDNVVTSTEVNGQQLFHPYESEYEGAIGPYITNPPGTKTDRILLDFVLSQGLGHYDDSGNFEEWDCVWDIDYREVDDFGNPLGTWVTVSYWIRMATRTPQRITKELNASAGRYEIRARSTLYYDGGQMTINTLVWAAMRAILPGTYKYPISCVAFSVKANNALTQSASRQFP